MMVVAYTDCYRAGDGLTLLATTVHRSSDSDEHRRSHDHHQQNRTKKTYLIRLQWHCKNCRSGSVGCRSEGGGCRSEGVSSRSESCGTISESCGLPPVIFYWCDILLMVKVPTVVVSTGVCRMQDIYRGMLKLENFLFREQLRTILDHKFQILEI